MESIYGWLWLMLLLASSGSVSLTSFVKLDEVELEEVRGLARRIVEQYDEDYSAYDWTDPMQEVDHIKDLLAAVVSPDFLSTAEQLAEILADIPLQDRAAAWSSLLATSDIADPGGAPIPLQSLAARRLVAEFLQIRRAKAALELAGGPWDDAYASDHPDSDVTSIARALHLSVGFMTLVRDLRSIAPQAELQALSNWMVEMAPFRDVPADLVDTSVGLLADDPSGPR